jgi:hypothetical protein
MTRSHIAILFLLLCSVSCRSPESNDIVQNDTVDAIDAPSHITAGDVIIIKVTSNKKSPPLKLWNAIGATIVEGIPTGAITEYTIPDPYHRTSGVLQWSIGKNYGTIDISPKIELSSLECYIGPTTALTGERGSYMMVGLATDIYDNTVSDNTEVMAHNYREGKLSRIPLRSRNGLVYKLYDSGTTVGNASMSLSHKAITTQEYKVAIGPNVPQPFTIRSITEHNKADGNSLIQLETGLIKDRYGNAIADGSLISWSIRGNESQSEVDSYTIDGRSTVEITHPTVAGTLKITASINGVYSNTLTKSFESGLQSYETALEDKLLTIGPMVSFLGQYIPDGFPIELRVSTTDQVVLDWTPLQSKNGYAQYDLSAIVSLWGASNNIYLIEVVSGGISQSLQMNTNE